MLRGVCKWKSGESAASVSRNPSTCLVYAAAVRINDSAHSAGETLSALRHRTLNRLAGALFEKARVLICLPFLYMMLFVETVGWNIASSRLYQHLTVPDRRLAGDPESCGNGYISNIYIPTYPIQHRLFWSPGERKP